jgi:molybdopterin converting factor small subunit
VRINRFAGWGIRGGIRTPRSREETPPPATVLLFATARTAVGRSRLEWPVPTDGIPARDLLRALTAQHPPLERIVRTSRILRNGEVVRHLSERIRPGDELAVHPPYGGG